MRKQQFVTAGAAIVLGSLLVVITFIAVPAGNAGGTGLLITPSPSATIDPGRATPTATRPPTTPTSVPTPTPRAGSLNITPSSGSIGTAITIAGSGFSPNALLAVIVENDAGVTMSYSQPAVDGSGAFTSRLETAEYAAGQYTVTVAALPNVKTLAQATFTLSGMPGLPNTGDGASTASPTRGAWVGGAALLVLLTMGGLALRRRPA